MNTDLRHSLEELAQVASVPERQIRELVRLGILPGPSSRGRGATYGTEHLDRLRAWKVLREKLPPKTTNEQIKILLEKLSDGGILRAIADGRMPFELQDDDKEEVDVRGDDASACRTIQSRGHQLGECQRAQVSMNRRSTTCLRFRELAG